MDLQDYLILLRRRWRSILFVALATLAATAAVTFIPTQQYTATTQLFFGVPGGGSVSDLAQGSTFTEQQMASYARVATSPLVLTPVIKELGLKTTPTDLAKTVTATAPLDTVILEIVALDKDPQQAARIANAVGKQVISVVSALVPDRAAGLQSVRATVLAEAQPPTSPSSPRVPLNLAIGLALAVVLGVGIALLRHLLNSKIRSEQDVHALTDSAVLGVVPLDTDTRTQAVVMHSRPLSARSEAVRRLRANIKFVDLANDVKSLVVTSSILQEGKTVTALNLAVAMSDAGLRVILVDADLRRPSLSAYAGIDSGGVGLTTILIGGADVADVVQPWRDTALHILPAGQVPPNPSELLSSANMSSLITQLSASYDMVLLDSPPLLPVSDALGLSNFADGTLLVVGVDRIRRPQLREALESLSTVDANLLGLVLNKIARRDSKAYVYDLGYAPDWGTAPAFSDAPASTAPARASAAASGRGVPAEAHPRAEEATGKQGVPAHTG